MREFIPFIKYLGFKNEIPKEANHGDMIVVENRIYIFNKDKWEEQLLPIPTLLDEFMEAIRAAEDSPLKRELIEIWKRHEGKEIF